MKIALSRRWGARLLVPVTAVVCALVGVVAPYLPASASPRPAAARLTVQLTISHDALQQAAHDAAASSGAGDAAVRPAISVPCSPGANEYDRTQLCTKSALTFTFINGTTPIGSTVAVLYQYSDLSATRTSWTEYDTVSSVTSKGTTEPITISLLGTCGPCTTSGDLFGKLANGLRGTETYSISLGKGHDASGTVKYSLVYSAPKYLPLTFGSSSSPLSFRCDNDVAATGEGCVYPKATPTLVLSIGQAGASAALFQWAQDHMKAHWGLYGKGSPLTRASGATGDDNRDVVCDGTFRRQGTVIVNGGKNDVDSCDEFPLASTNQSGAGTLKKEKKTGAACVQLQSVRTAKTGTEARQWGGVKVIGTPNYGAPCVRGHVPNRLNGSTGGSYNTFIRYQRLFVNESFWVAVES
jgi:hypothetical protein